MSGHPVRVVTVVAKDEGEPHISLDEKALREVLLQEHVKDLPVVIVSVAGKLHQGNSSFLNFVVRYLRQKGSEDWLTDEAGPLSVWEPGNCATAGIVVWSEVFVVDGPDGRRVAVLLMDTQAMYNCVPKVKECRTAFALSTMLSSLQIFGVLQVVARHDVESLELFTRYCDATGGGGSKRLQLVVLNWGWCSSTPCGADVGGRFLGESTAGYDGTKPRVDSIDGFLLPYSNATWTPPYNVHTLSVLGDSFKSLMNELLSGWLSWENVSRLVEKTRGEAVTLGDLPSHFAAYVEIFQDGRMPSPRSALEEFNEMLKNVNRRGERL